MALKDTKSPPGWIWNWLSSENLKALENYAYTGIDLSFLVDLFLRDFWNWCMNFVPLWMAYATLSVYWFNLLGQILSL
jgi:ethanolaminephosphotransferase